MEQKIKKKLAKIASFYNFFMLNSNALNHNVGYFIICVIIEVIVDEFVTQPIIAWNKFMCEIMFTKKVLDASYIMLWKKPSGIMLIIINANSIYTMPCINPNTAPRILSVFFKKLILSRKEETSLPSKKNNILNNINNIITEIIAVT